MVTQPPPWGAYSSESDVMPLKMEIQKMVLMPHTSNEITSNYTDI